MTLTPKGRRESSRNSEKDDTISFDHYHQDENRKINMHIKGLENDLDGYKPGIDEAVLSSSNSEEDHF